MIGRTVAEIAPGQSAELVRTVATEDVAEFIGAVGDWNPIHSDPAFAAATPFKEPIAPGVFTAGLISAVIGTRLPGPGSIYLSQTLKFVRPVRSGDTITARVEVLEVVPARHRVRLGTVCRNQHGEEVLVGEAWVMPPRRSVTYERATAGPVGVAGLALQSWACAARALALWGALGLSLLAGGWRPRT